ncbi:T9SS type A sorting domain-containing protein [Mariniflexile sp. HNIBRBA6329]|uniref:T9SS type A sorting domain-containing protein n=1 Tax=Mariniflexile sp. HNIBRBA6329 TaxID=3373088 RepID=UPI00374577C0
MRFDFFISIFLISFSTIAQNLSIDDGSWYLYNMNIDGENHYTPLSSEGTPIVSQFSSENDQKSFNTTICNSHYVQYEIHFELDISKLTLIDGASTLGDCDYASNVMPEYISDIESKFTNFFFDDYTNGESFSYEIFEGDDFRQLDIYAPNGDVLIYFFETLSTSKDTFDLSFSIYPNPTEDILTFKTSNKSIVYNIFIYDFTGKKLLNRKFQCANFSFNVENFVSGIYFISVEDSFGNRSQKKFIKQ